MSTETIFFTQLASILTFVVTLFVLYRVLVNQKDATIELLREQISALKEQLSKATQQSPDEVVKRLAERVKIITEELSRLHQDKTANQALIAAKEAELNNAQQELADVKEKLEYAREIAAEYFCPHCQSALDVQEYHSQLVEFGGRAVDVDHEYKSFPCGFALADGKIVSPCRFSNPENEPRT